ncbi:DUF4328 domain-containing protein [Arsenicicoccus cauae]|uniref:DUF4328 domain-containing protein n=1 Tax=Arsenicicoccus cauae TaxID=2663847 RepID=UPI0025924D93|nr:DUF4328 domain-containing protein [uncultured Arsenicicoccus sp.]
MSTRTPPGHEPGTSHHSSSHQPQGWFAAPPWGPPLDRSFRTLGTAITVLIGLVGLLELAQLAGGVRMLRLLGEVGSGREGLDADLDAADRLTLQLLLPYLLLLLAAGVCWLVWQHRLATSTRVDRREVRRSPGWHVGSWFIPVANLWFPYQNVSDLDRGLGHFSGRERRPPLLAWWVLWLLGIVVSRVAAATGSTADDHLEAGRIDEAVSLMSTSVTIELVGNVLGAVSALLAILVVSNLTQRATRPADTPWTSPDTHVQTDPGTTGPARGARG